MPQQCCFFVLAVVALSLIGLMPLSGGPTLQQDFPGNTISQGTPLEHFLWDCGLYPVTGIFAGSHYIDWADAAYRSRWSIPVLVRPDGGLEAFGQRINTSMAGVVTVPRPDRSVLDVAPTVCGALGLEGQFDGKCLCQANASQVVVVYVDALGWYRYCRAKPLMGNLSRLEPAVACDVYPSISDVNAAAMITGVGPEKSGVDSWERRQLKVDNVIALAQRHGVSAAWVDGPRPPIELQGGAIRVEDARGDGGADDRIMDRAVTEYRKGTRLLYVHLPDVDRVLHASGPYSQRSLEAMARADVLLGKLVSHLGNRTLLIVTADHGGHDVAGCRGDHGSLLPDDMLIPLAVSLC